MMKISVISFMLFFVCLAVFAQDGRQLSPSDIIGTFRLEKVEHLWKGDPERNEEDLKLFDNFKSFEIGKDYYILGNQRNDATFQVVKIRGDPGVEYIPAPDGSWEQSTSESMMLFLEYPRLFDSAIAVDRVVQAIEVFDHDTLVLHLFHAWQLYKRVE